MVVRNSRQTDVVGPQGWHTCGQWFHDTKGRSAQQELEQSPGRAWTGALHTQLLWQQERWSWPQMVVSGKQLVYLSNGVNTTRRHHHINLTTMSAPATVTCCPTK